MALIRLAVHLHRAFKLSVLIKVTANTVIRIQKFLRRKKLLGVNEIFSRVVIRLMVPKRHLNDRLCMPRRHGIGKAAQHPDKICGPVDILGINILLQNLRCWADDEVCAVPFSGKAERRNIGIYFLRVDVKIFQIRQDRSGILFRNTIFQTFDIAADDIHHVPDFLPGRHRTSREEPYRNFYVV